MMVMPNLRGGEGVASPGTPPYESDSDSNPEIHMYGPSYFDEFFLGCQVLHFWRVDQGLSGMILMMRI